MNRPAEETASRWFGSQGADTARLMVYLLASIALMALDQRGQYVDRIQQWGMTAAEPIYALVEWPQRAVEGTAQSLRTRASLREENTLLRRELMRQAAEVQRIAALQQENARLRSLLDATSGRRFEYLFAELSQVDLDPFSHRVLIDRGSRDGVTLGQAVIDGLGIVGQVDELGLGHAQVRLISDPSHALPVQINRTGLRTVAYGRGETAALELPSVPPQADVREGDLLVTSGLADRFPPGYPVALVSRVERDTGDAFVRVEATPLAALDRGREVLLVVPVEAPEPASPEAGPEAASPSDDVGPAEAGADGAGAGDAGMRDDGLSDDGADPPPAAEPGSDDAPVGDEGDVGDTTEPVE